MKLNEPGNAETIIICTKLMKWMSKSLKCYIFFLVACEAELLQSPGRDKLEHPLQFPQASPQLLSNPPPPIPPLPHPDHNVHLSWSRSGQSLEDVVHRLLDNLTKLAVSRGWEQSLVSVSGVHVLVEPAAAASRPPRWRCG